MAQLGHHVFVEHRWSRLHTYINVWQGRRWPDVESRFEQMWSMTLRALDDIKVLIPFLRV